MQQVTDERSTLFLHIRPQLAFHDQDTQEPHSELIHFQNQTLRPILKMQHELLVAVFNDYILQHKVPLGEMHEDKRRMYLYQAPARDAALKHLLTGVIIGCFTLSELNFYMQHRQELNRRIMKFISKRMDDHWQIQAE